MKRKTISGKRLASPIFVIGILLILAIGLLTENCLEICDSAITDQKTLKDIRNESAM